MLINIPLCIVLSFSCLLFFNFCKFLSHSFCTWECCILSLSFHPCLMVFLKLFWKLIVDFIIFISILSSSKMSMNCLFLHKGSKVHRLLNFCCNPSLILFVKSLRSHQVIEQLQFIIHVNWHYCMGSHLALC